MAIVLASEGEEVNRKRIKRLMGLMGLEAIHPGPRTTVHNPDHKVYPYLLRGVKIERRDQVWSSEITYIPMHQGFMYLTVVIDWYSRYVLSWNLSNSLDGRFCVETLEEALRGGKPEIFNTDQGVQYTAKSFTGRLEAAGVSVSMDGRGRALDNVFVERLWRSLKYEEVYLKDYRSVTELVTGLTNWFRFYNHERPHQSLGCPLAERPGLLGNGNRPGHPHQSDLYRHGLRQPHSRPPGRDPTFGHPSDRSASRLPGPATAGGVDRRGDGPGDRHSRAVRSCPGPDRREPFVRHPEQHGDRRPPAGPGQLRLVSAGVPGPPHDADGENVL